MKCSKCGTKTEKEEIRTIDGPETHHVCPECDTHHDEDGDEIQICSYCHEVWIGMWSSWCHSCQEWEEAHY